MKHLPVPTPESNVPRRGNKFTLMLGKILLAASGWQITGNIPNESKLVIAWAPHTSYWDWFICMAAMLTLQLKTSWMAADGFFWWPLGVLMSWLGGIPIDRRASHGIVAQVVQRFNTSDDLLLAIAPEGTRKKVSRWKSGFYYIAKEANIPITLVSLDYTNKIFSIGPTLAPTGNADEDIANMQNHFKKSGAKYPDQF